MDENDDASSREVSLPETVVLNRSLSYLGKAGRQREAFCRDYAAYLKMQHVSLADRMRQQATSNNQSITCTQGCASCCHLCVIASIQECEAIVHYLYEHEEALRYYLDSFNRWREQVRGIWDAFQEITRLESKRLSTDLTEAEENAFGDALFAYRQAEIPCPFLKEGSCVVYEARPLVCAGLGAVTSPQWCSYLHPNYGQSEFIVLEPEKDDYVPYFANPGEKTCFACMPVGVYEILFNSWGFLWTLPGCGWLEKEVRADPEIQSGLRSFGK